MSESIYKKNVKSHLEAYLPALWLEGFGNIVDLKLTKDPKLKGATDAIFYKVRASTEFVIKFGLNDVPKEKKGYRILKNASKTFAKHLVPLLGETKGIEDEGLNKAILLTPFINSLTLHDIVSNYQRITTKTWILKVYSDYLNELRLLWTKTKKACKLSLKDIYFKRLSSRLQEFKGKKGLNRSANLILKINGKTVKIEEKIKPSIQHKLENFENKVKYSCIIHGDEHPKNILIRRENIGLNEKYWYLIDCGNALEQGDWIFSIAKILHWWKVYFAIENAKKRKDLNGKVEKISNNTLKIEYDENSFRKRIPKICDELYHKTLKFCKQVNKEVFLEPASVWQERLKIALFIILFGAVTRHLDKEKKFAIPFLIGESFRFLEGL
ncbi:hypothetical protein J7L36_02140 [bacterium]|nr:hypothetical protein [bacterium]